MNLKNILRTVFRIRTVREMLPPGPKPQVGSNIVLDRLRIRLKYPISDEQWDWFTKKGWRTIDMRGNRRRYFCIPEKFLGKILNADEATRNVLHQSLLVMIEGNKARNRIEGNKARNRQVRSELPPAQNSQLRRGTI